MYQFFIRTVGVITIVFFGCASVTMAQVMSSSNFQLQSDSVNAGGQLSSSASFSLEDTVGEIATGEGNSASFELQAGYQQMQETYVAISGASNVAMSPIISASGTASGTAALTVITDNASGYQLQIAASNAPAMQSDANTLADYTPAGAVPDFAFTTAASDAHFGFSPQGTDIVDRFKDNGTACGTGALDTVDACFQGLTTTDTTIASSSNPNHPAGVVTSIVFTVGVGASSGAVPGTYVATTTVTAIAL